MKKFSYWLPSFIWMFVIFTFSAQPTLRVSSVNWQDFALRKTAHFVEYFILFFLYLFSLRKTTRLSYAKAGVVALSFAVVYAATDELHQLFVTGREGRLRDVAIDTFGALFGWYSSRRW